MARKTGPSSSFGTRAVARPESWPDAEQAAATQRRAALAICQTARGKYGVAGVRELLEIVGINPRDVKPCAVHGTACYPGGCVIEATNNEDDHA